jgi:Mg2+-importing ATPase
VETPVREPDTIASAFWSLDLDAAITAAASTPNGLTGTEARDRLARYGANRIGEHHRPGDLILLLRQFRSPIILILLAAALLSGFLGDPTDSVIILAIVLVSGMLSFWQERGAVDAVDKLLAVVTVRTRVMRDGVETELPVADVVRGDVVALDAGDTIPADALILDSRDLFVDESTLTGETFPVEKEPGVLPADTPLAKRTNALFMGTHVVSGTARALVVLTGEATQFGNVAGRLETAPAETEFEQGIRRFGFFLMEVTLVLVLGIFAVNVYLHKPVVDSLLFSLALAVGLTPQLLPAIVSINLAHGARRMAERKVIVKRLAAIEDFGSMDVLCSDKTGTLTEGTVHLHAAFDTAGRESDEVLLYAYLNSRFETGFTNPIDEAVRAAKVIDVSRVRKLDEVPYDFIRKRLTVLVAREGKPFMVTKGALTSVLDVCSTARVTGGKTARLDSVRPDIERLYERLSAQGYRTLGVAIRDDIVSERIDKRSETDMTFVGVLAFVDPAKQGAAAAVESLSALGVSLKIITGDNALVARTLGGHMGLATPTILTGPELTAMHDTALTGRVRGVDIFAEVEPNQKERIIHALKRAGYVVGYMGDGINDASALHAADVGISVSSAVDVAKEAADIVLLEPGLDVLARGVEDGRLTFANTLKYVFMATSANFGNMFSMAGASMFLSFLPLLPTQVLLTNLLTDFPEMAIASDRVDPELVETPRRWDIRFIRDFMLTFGLLSSVFDFATFGVLLFVLKVGSDPAGQALFRTGWFVESVLSASMVVLVIRTRRPIWRSRPGRTLTIATVCVWVATLALPYTPLGVVFKFAPLPWTFLAMLAGILVAYVSTAEVAKALFYRAHPDKPVRARRHRAVAPAMERR